MVDIRPNPRPQLLYGCASHESLSTILRALPPRLTVDRLVSRYFNDLNLAAGESNALSSYTCPDSVSISSGLADMISRQVSCTQANSFARYVLL